MRITKADATWNLTATGLRVASGIIVLPLVLYFLPQEELALWTIFLSFGAMVPLLDFGFSNTFARNITYVFSGARELKPEGYVKIDEACGTDYSLLKGLIRSMRLFYGGLSLLFLLLLLTFGSLYLHRVLGTYGGDKDAVLIAWALYSVIISAQLYTLSYDALMQGRGQMKRNKQIVTLAQVVQIAVSASALIMGCGIISMVYGQLASLVVNRILAYKAFYDKGLKKNLKACSSALAVTDVLKVIAPNAVKVGVTILGGFLTSRAGVFVASLYLPLSDVASYGITQQVIDILATLSMVWLNTFAPRIAQFRITGDLAGVKRLYLKSWIFFLFIFICGSLVLLLWGNQILTAIHSKTLFLPAYIFALGLFASLLETHYTMAVIILLSKNEVPYYKASLFWGVANLVLLFVFVGYLYTGVAGIFLAKGLSLLYNSWRWPHSVKNELQVRWSDYRDIFLTFVKEIKK